MFRTYTLTRVYLKNISKLFYTIPKYNMLAFIGIASVTDSFNKIKNFYLRFQRVNDRIFKSDLNRFNLQGKIR